MTFDEVTAAGAQIVHLVIRRLLRTGGARFQSTSFAASASRLARTPRSQRCQSVPPRTDHLSGLLDRSQSGRVGGTRFHRPVERRPGIRGDDTEEGAVQPRGGSKGAPAEAEPDPDEVLEPIEIEVTTGGATADPTGLRSSLARQPRKKWPQAETDSERPKSLHAPSIQSAAASRKGTRYRFRYRYRGSPGVVTR